MISNWVLIDLSNFIAEYTYPQPQSLELCLILVVRKSSAVGLTRTLVKF